MLKEKSHDAHPATGTGFVQGTTTSVVTVVNITVLVFQAIQQPFLGAQAGCLMQQCLFGLPVKRDGAGVGWHGAVQLQHRRLWGRQRGRLLQLLVQLLLVGFGRQAAAV